MTPFLSLSLSIDFSRRGGGAISPQIGSQDLTYYHFGLLRVIFQHVGTAYRSQWGPGVRTRLPNDRANDNDSGSAETRFSIRTQPFHLISRSNAVDDTKGKTRDAGNAVDGRGDSEYGKARTTRVSHAEQSSRFATEGAVSFPSFERSPIPSSSHSKGWIRFYVRARSESQSLKRREGERKSVGEREFVREAVEKVFLPPLPERGKNPSRRSASRIWLFVPQKAAGLEARALKVKGWKKDAARR